MQLPWPPSRHGRAPVRPRADDARDSKRVRRLLVAGVAVIAFAAGAVEGSLSSDLRRDAAERYGQAWERDDYAEMHGLLDAESRRRAPLADFVAAHRAAAQTLTLATLRAGDAREAGEDAMRLPVAFETRAFGTLRASLDLTVREEDGRAAIAWTPRLVFGGLREGEALRRELLGLPPGSTRFQRWYEHADRPRPEDAAGVP